MSEEADADYAAARRYALWRLARFSQSSQTLADALERRGVSEACRERLIEELTQAGFLNDGDYARQLVASEQSRARGPAFIRAKLFRKGIAPELIASALETVDEEGQRAALQRLLTTRYARRDLTAYKERQKVIAALIRRGFALELILRETTKESKE